jgi:hypothetical protein
VVPEATEAVGVGIAVLLCAATSDARAARKRVVRCMANYYLRLGDGFKDVLEERKTRTIGRECLNESLRSQERMTTMNAEEQNARKERLIGEASRVEENKGDAEHESRPSDSRDDGANVLASRDRNLSMERLNHAPLVLWTSKWVRPIG